MESDGPTVFQRQRVCVGGLTALWRYDKIERR